MLLEPQRLPRTSHTGVLLDPGVFNSGQDLTHGPTNTAGHSGVSLECRVDLPIEHVRRTSRVIIEHFERAKSLVDGVEDRAVLRLALAQRELGARPLDRTPCALRRFAHEVDLVGGPCARRPTLHAEARDVRPPLHQSHADNGRDIHGAKGLAGVVVDPRVGGHVVHHVRLAAQVDRDVLAPHRRRVLAGHRRHVGSPVAVDNDGVLLGLGVQRAVGAKPLTEQAGSLALNRHRVDEWPERVAQGEDERLPRFGRAQRRLRRGLEGDAVDADHWTGGIADLAYRRKGERVEARRQRPVQCVTAERRRHVAQADGLAGVHAREQRLEYRARFRHHVEVRAAEHRRMQSAHERDVGVVVDERQLGTPEERARHARREDERGEHAQ